MARRTDFRKAITYEGQAIDGRIDVTYKIDGCRVLYRDNEFLSRNNKVYPGLKKACTSAALQLIEFHKDCEIYVEDFLTTNSLLQRHDPESGAIKAEHIYKLDVGGKCDTRLHIRSEENIQLDTVEKYLDKALDLGYEGLVLRGDKHWYRVKPTLTADVYITGWREQVDKHKNGKDVLGAFLTDYGAVTAFKEEDRTKLWDDPDQYVGRLMEVSYKELYHTGKFRFAVKFERFRDDKDEVSFDTRTKSTVRYL